MRDVVVVGAGIGGLTAARDLVRAGRDVLVLEGSPEVGGKLRLGRRWPGWSSTSAPRRCSTAAPRGSRWPRSSGSTSCTRRPPRRRCGPAAPCAAAALADGSAVRPRRARLERRPLRGGPGPGQRRARRCRRRPTTSRSATWSPSGWATRWSSGWSSPCSVACTPAARGASPRPPRCPQLLAMARRGSLLDQASTIVPSRRPGLRRASPAGWASSPRCSPAGLEVRTSTHRCARWSGAPGGWRAHRRLGRARRRRSWPASVVLATPGRPDRPAPRRRRARAPPGTSRRSSRPAWRW